MITRRNLLKAMLAAFGFSALSGILAMFVPDRDVVWRVAGNGLIAAVTAGVMMLMSLLADRPRTRAAGMLGMALCAAEFLLVSILVWIDIFGYQWTQASGLTALCLVPCGIVATSFLARINADGWRTAARFGCLGMACAFLFFVAAAFIEGFDLFGPGSYHLWGTGWALFWAMLTIGLALVGLARPDPAPWRWLGVLGTVAGTAMVIYGIWMESGRSPFWPVLCLTIGAVVTHGILCSRVTLIGAQRYVRFLAVIGAITTGIFVVYLSAEHRSNDWYGFDRLVTATGILTISASLALMVLARMNRKVDIELTPLKSIERITLFCPRCDKKQELPVGGAMCGGCKLHINVQVQTSRCATCGYDLSNLGADRCPECGTAIPAVPNL